MQHQQGSRGMDPPVHHDVEGEDLQGEDDVGGDLRHRRALAECINSLITPHLIVDHPSLATGYYKHNHMRANSSLHARASHSRHPHSPSHYQTPTLTPRSLQAMSPRPALEPDPGHRMRLMKSRMSNSGVDPMAAGDNKIFPNELLFLLGNEEGNVEHFRKTISEEKARVERDFQKLSQEISHILEDLKLSLTAELDILFRDFMTLYGELKHRVSRLRDVRKQVFEAHSPSEYYHGSERRPLPKVSSSHNISNRDLLRELSQDEEYFRNQHFYESVTDAHMKSLGPVMQVARDIISLGSEQEFYQGDKGNEVIKRIRNSFFDSTKAVFESEMQALVTPSQQILLKNTQVLQGMDQIEERSEPKMAENSQAQNKVNPQQGLPQSNRSRPSSFSEYQKLQSRADSQWSSQKKHPLPNQEYELSGKPLRLQVARTQQNAMSESLQSVRLADHTKNPLIECGDAQGVVLCILFIGSGKRMAVGCKDSHIYVYEVSDGKLVAKLSGHKASICTLANFGGFFASGSDSGCNSLATWDSSHLKMRSKVKLHKAALTCIVDLCDGFHLATAGYDKRILVYNYSRGETAFEVSSNKASVASMAFCNQSKKLVSAGLDLTLSIWNVFTKNMVVEDVKLDRIVTNCGLVSVIRPLTLSSDLILAGNQQGKVILLNVHSGEVFKTLTVGKGIVLELVVLERGKQPNYPYIITYSSNQREALLTRLDTGASEYLKTSSPIQILHGCGISPTMAFGPNNLIGIVSQVENNKSVRLYSIEGH